MPDVLRHIIRGTHGVEGAASGFVDLSTPTRSTMQQCADDERSFQLNEARAQFDDSDSLPVWPTPRGNVYTAPEARGVAALPVQHEERPRTNPQQPSTRITRRSRGSAAPPTTDTRQTAPASRSRSPPTSSSAAQQQQQQQQQQQHYATAAVQPDVAPSHHAQRAPELPAQQVDADGALLAQLLSRGEVLRQRMLKASTGTASSAADSQHTAAAAGSLAAAGLPVQFPVRVPAAPVAGVGRRHGPLDDIDGSYGAFSDEGSEASEVYYGGLSGQRQQQSQQQQQRGGGWGGFRDAEQIADEDRMVDLLLKAAGPPPTSLAFPSLSALERARSEALQQVRFVRIRLHRLVMFGSLTSAADGCGWQLRFRLPPCCIAPNAGSAGSAADQQRCRDGMVAVPVPTRASSSSAAAAKAQGKRGSTASAGITAAAAAAAAAASRGASQRVRRGYGCTDLAVGETVLYEEVVCAVHMDDAACRTWMSTTLDLLLVDGSEKGLPATATAAAASSHKPAQLLPPAPPLVVSSDKVAGLARLPLRDVLLSPELGAAVSVDVKEVVDFWAAGKKGSSAVRGRGGHPLHNPYRGPGLEDATLMLGKRAIGALVVSVVLLPGASGEREPQTIGVQEAAGSEQQQQQQRQQQQQQQQAQQQRSSEISEIVESVRCAAPVPAVPPPRPAPKQQQQQQQQLQQQQQSLTETAPTGHLLVRLEGAHSLSLGTLLMAGKGSGHPLLPPSLKLALAQSAALQLRCLRVSYSLGREGGAAAVTRHSAVGQPLTVHTSNSSSNSSSSSSSAWVLGHETLSEVVADGAARAAWLKRSLILEVWVAAGSSSSSNTGSSTDEFLLGLAKVSLAPLAEGIPAHSSLPVTAVDGTVAVTDPFTGASVGSLVVLVALSGGSAEQLASTSAGAARAARFRAAMRELQQQSSSSSGDAPRSDTQHRERSQSPVRQAAATASSADASLRQQSDATEQQSDFTAATTTAAVPTAESAAAAVLTPPASPRSDRVNSASQPHQQQQQLIAHTFELSVKGEMPLPESAFTDEPDAPALGCTISYSFAASSNSSSSSSSSSSSAGSLWWDADSAVLNSRARHTVRVPSSSRVGADAAEHSALLDAVCGDSDGIVLELRWSGNTTVSASASTAERTVTQPLLGTAVLSRAQLAALLTAHSSVQHLSLPVTAAADALSIVPAVLPLAVSYRREPSTVARRIGSSNSLAAVSLSPQQLAAREPLLPAKTTVCISVAAVAGLQQYSGQYVWAVVRFFQSNLATATATTAAAAAAVAVADEATEQDYVSPAVAVRSDGAAELQWQVEVPVAIGRVFVEYVREHSATVTVFASSEQPEQSSSDSSDSSTAQQQQQQQQGTAVCSAELALRDLFEPVGAVSGNVQLQPGGCAAEVAVYFKHRGKPDASSTSSVTLSTEAATVDSDSGVFAGITSNSSAAGTSIADSADTAAADAAVVDDWQIIDAAEVAAAAATADNDAAVAAAPAVAAPAEPTAVVEVAIERALRLPLDAVHDAEGLLQHVPPSTYVTCQWELDGKAPLRPPFTVRSSNSSSSSSATSEGEVVTQVVRSSSSPAYSAAAELLVPDTEQGWARLCCTAAALVFRVWRRGAPAWWSSAATAAAAAGESAGTVDEEGASFAASPRLGDKLIGAAVVDLAALRVGSSLRTAGLSEIDGWYHILDDMQRPQGQLKVRVTPQRHLAVVSSAAAQAVAAVASSDAAWQGLDSSASAADSDSERSFAYTHVQRDIARVQSLLAAFPQALWDAQSATATATTATTATGAATATIGEPTEPFSSALSTAAEEEIQLQERTPGFSEIKQMLLDLEQVNQRLGQWGQHSDSDSTAAAAVAAPTATAAAAEELQHARSSAGAAHAGLARTAAERTAAAVKLQARHRGAAGRSRALARKRERSAAATAATTAAAAAARASTAAQQAAAQAAAAEAAAARIQRAWEHSTQRRVAVQQLTRLRQQHQRQQQRQRALRERECTLTLQAAWRGHSGRRCAAALRAEQLAAKRRGAMLTLQCVVRGWLGRRRAVRLRRARRAEQQGLRLSEQQQHQQQQQQQQQEQEHRDTETQQQPAVAAATTTAATVLVTASTVEPSAAAATLDDATTTPQQQQQQQQASPTQRAAGVDAANQTDSCEAADATNDALQQQQQRQQPIALDVRVDLHGTAAIVSSQQSTAAAVAPAWTPLQSVGYYPQQQQQQQQQRQPTAAQPSSRYTGNAARPYEYKPPATSSSSSSSSSGAFTTAAARQFYSSSSEAKVLPPRSTAAISKSSTTAAVAGSGALRPTRFADIETARIARIMQGSLNYFATESDDSF
jgi:hypothetical protein